MSGKASQPNQSLLTTHTSQARHLYSESKSRLCERIAANIQSSGSGILSQKLCFVEINCFCEAVMRQIVKGSKSVDVNNN